MHSWYVDFLYLALSKSELLGARPASPTLPHCTQKLLLQQGQISPHTMCAQTGPHAILVQLGTADVPLYPMRSTYMAGSRRHL